LAAAALLVAGALAHCNAVELKVSREAHRSHPQTAALQWTQRPLLPQRQRPNPPATSTPRTQSFSFVQDRIVVQVKTHARLGKSVGGACLGISLTLPAEVSLAPDGEGETIGFRDARVDRVSDQKELNFLLTPFLSHQIPSSMKVNAADLLRKRAPGLDRFDRIQDDPGTTQGPFYSNPGRPPRRRRGRRSKCPIEPPPSFLVA
jgi:hypothetical protein